MKKILTTLIFILACTISSNASHLVGGEISWECLGSGKYVFKMTIYRDCTGINFDMTNRILDITGSPLPGDANNNVVSSIILKPDSNRWNNAQQGNLQPQCKGNELNCGSGDQGAMQAFWFKSDPLTLKGNPPANGWTFSFSAPCCRPSDIANVNSNGTALLRAIMFPIPGGLNSDSCKDSSPLFNALPSSTICRSLDFTYNNTAIDYDLDSLVYSFDRPYNTPANNPNPLTYKAGFTPTNPTPDQNANINNIPATLDPLSGIMRMAVFSGFGTNKYINVFRVDAYREGQRIASVFRELPFSVFDCQPLNDTNGNTAGPNNVPEIYIDGLPNDAVENVVIAGQRIQLPIQIRDNDLGGANGNQPQEISLTADGLLFTNTRGPNSPCFIQNRDVEPCAYLRNLTPTLDTNAFPPVFNIKGLGVINTVFEWEPNCKHLQTKTGFPGTNEGIYNFVMRVQDDHCPIPAINYPTITVKVRDPLPLERPVMVGASVKLDGTIFYSWIAPLDSTNSFNKYQTELFRQSVNSSQGNYNRIKDSILNYKYTDSVQHSFFPVYDFKNVIDPTSGPNLLSKAGSLFNMNYNWYVRMKVFSGCSDSSTSPWSSFIRIMELEASEGGISNQRDSVLLQWNSPEFDTINNSSNIIKKSRTRYYIHVSDSLKVNGIITDSLLKDFDNWYISGSTYDTAKITTSGNCNGYSAFRIEARDTVISYKQGSSVLDAELDTTYYSNFSTIDTLYTTGGTPSVVHVENRYLQSSVERSAYQWIDCSTNHPIANETGRDFTPQTPGFYKVIASNPNCSDTSACFEATPISNDTIVNNEHEFLSIRAAGFDWEWTACSGSIILSSGTNRFAPNQFESYKVLTKKFGYSKLSACFEVLPFTVSAINRSNDSLVSVESAVSYQWFKGCASLPVEVSGATKKQFVPKSPGDYFVRATRFNIDVTSNCVNAQELNDTILILNNSTLKSADSTADYEWMECRNIPLVNNNSQVFNATDTGIYAVKVSAYGYSKTSDCVAMFAVGLEEATLQEKISFYPNPTNGELTIQFDHNQSELNVEVYSIQGKLVDRKNYINQGRINLVLNQPSGIYFIQLKNEKGEIANFKVVKR